MTYYTSFLPWSLLSSTFCLLTLGEPVFAQIVPDNSLGNEQSVVTSVNSQLEQITGGATRGSALFHSFLEFNINEGNAAYFVNPIAIETIFSRVTGNNPSEILGTLGVLGEADLYLINPNGILFGPNAQLDIKGSFVASTANSLVLPNGIDFSATNPQTPPLLEIDADVSIGLVFEGGPPGDIVNAGSLAVGEDLQLVAGNLDLQGELVAGNNLVLLAEDTVKIRDSEVEPFSAVAGSNFLVQGNQGIDILALNHPQAAFQSGGNLIMMSDGIISGDARFISGGNFLLLNLAGEPGEFVSYYDPIISSVGDVVLGDYTGVALKIESMGSIQTGDITITGPDTILADGSDPDIDILKSSPALIIRAGLEELQNAPTVYWNDFTGNVSSEWSSQKTNITPEGNRSFLGQLDNSSTVSLQLSDLPAHNQATISFDLFIIRSWDGNEPDIWELSIPGGPKLLRTTFSNVDFPVPSSPKPQSYPSQYSPASITNQPARTGTVENNSLGYNFFFGSIQQRKAVDSVYHFSFPFAHSDSSLQFDFSASKSRAPISDESWGLDNVNVSVEPVAPSDLIPSLSNPNLTFPGSVSPGTITTGRISTPGGPIILEATSDITTNGLIRSQGGDIDISNRSGDINLRANIISDGGEITLNSREEILVAAGVTVDATNQSGKGDGGDINITGRSLLMNEEARFRTRVIGNNQGGSINVATSESFTILGSASVNSDSSGLFATNDGSGAPGKIVVKTPELLLQGRARIITSTFAGGDAGEIMIDVARLRVEDGARISALTSVPVAIPGDGKGGELTVIASELVEVRGTSDDEILPSAISTGSLRNGDAGNLTIDTPRLFVLDGGVVNTSTLEAGKGGNLTIQNARLVEVSGASKNGRIASTISTDTTGRDPAGNLTINTDRLVVRDGGIVSASTLGKGEGGDLIVNAPVIELRGSGSNGFASGLYAQAFAGGNGGELIVNTQGLTIQDSARITVSASQTPNIQTDQILRLLNAFPGISSPTIPNQVTGNAGNIRVTADSILLNNQGAIIAQTESSEGGNIDLFVSCLLLLRNNSQISTTAGTAQAGGNGGNITIDAPKGFIIAFPGEDSDITANAFEGNGGRVNISTQAIFGLEFRDRTTSLSDITASSEQGLAGEVNINLTVETEPEQGLTSQPNEPVEVELIEGCQIGRGRESAQYSYIGEGGSGETADTPVSPWLPLPNSEPDSESAASGETGNLVRC
ncbi:MAG: filamentous hemagglutinin N-terminal domain-containing protein [Symploca sp. SIO3E6]|nr:filamentous hemagglutinin N-terminal domain-containing protein [Caldora sp. SIO3E6]